MKFRLLSISLIVLLSTFLSASARTFDNEQLRYKVLYRWGLINKTAGYATLRMLPGGGETCTAQLTAASEPWADHFYKVRDTLTSVMNRADYTPRFYEKIAHEGTELKHDIVRFSKKGYTSTGDCVRKVWKKGKQKVDEARTLTARGTTVDMLTSFYYMRTLPYEQWKSGHKEELNIYSGKRKELLTITYHGIDDVETENHSFRCYHITFTFTSDDRKKTSDDMDAWITTDSRRLPVRLEGTLPVGKVHCLYTGK